MGERTAIAWTATVDPDGTVTPGATWNPCYGCHKVSPGCARCYMDRWAGRAGHDPGVVKRAAPSTLTAPLRWREPRPIFTCSLSDFFVAEADPWRGQAWEIIRATPRHTYLILTKRAERIADQLPADWGDGWPNVWLGVSI